MALKSALSPLFPRVRATDWQDGAMMSHHATHHFSRRRRRSAFRNPVPPYLFALRSRRDPHEVKSRKCKWVTDFFNCGGDWLTSLQFTHPHPALNGRPPRGKFPEASEFGSVYGGVSLPFAAPKIGAGTKAVADLYVTAPPLFSIGLEPGTWPHIRPPLCICASRRSVNALPFGPEDW